MLYQLAPVYDLVVVEKLQIFALLCDLSIVYQFVVRVQKLATTLANEKAVEKSRVFDQQALGDVEFEGSL